MRNVTKVQKELLITLSEEFYPDLLDLLSRGGTEEVVLLNEEECNLFKSFGDMIVDSVGEKYPNNESLNDDAILAVHLSDRIISRYLKKPNNSE